MTDPLPQTRASLTLEFPKPWTDEVVRAADVVVSMGCGDACPVRPIRDDVERRVLHLLAELGTSTGAPAVRDEA